MFYIIREPDPNATAMQAKTRRYLTDRGGWTNDMANARPFDTRAEAEKKTGGRTEYGIIIEIL